MVHRAWGQKGKRWAAEGGVCDSGAPLPPPIFSPFSLSAARHSAAAVRRGGTPNSPVYASTAKRNPQLASVRSF